MLSKFLVIFLILPTLGCSSMPTVKSDLIQDNSSLDKEDIVPEGIESFKAVKKESRQDKPKPKKINKNVIAASGPIVHLEKEASRVTSIPFSEGENQKFSAYFGNIKAGEVEMSILPAAIIDGKDAYHFKASIKTTAKIINALFKINENIESFVDQKTFSSIRYQLVGQEGSKAKNNMEFYDIKNLKTMTWYREEQDGQKTDRKENFDTLQKFSQDILSSFYYVRTIDFSEIKSTTFPVVSKEKVTATSVRVIGEEDLKVKNSTISCWIIGLKLDPSKPDEHKIWIEKDNSKRIYQIQAKTNLGSFTAKREN